MNKKYLLLIPLLLFLFIPKDTFAQTLYPSLKLVQSTDGSSLENRSLVNQSVFGYTFVGHNYPGKVGYSRYSLDFSDLNLNFNNRYDIDFLLFYSNVNGASGTVPLVQFNNKTCDVVSAGQYKNGSFSNLYGWRYKNNSYGEAPIIPVIDGVIRDDTPISFEDNISVTYLFGVSCSNAQISSPESTIKVYTSSSDSIRSTPFYGLSNFMEINTNVDSQIIDETKKQTEEQKKTNEKLDDVKDSITDDSAPDSSSLSNENVIGLLPAGPLDSIINLPLSLLNSISNSLHGTCATLDVPVPFSKDKLSIPCVNDLYSRIKGLNAVISAFSLILSGLMLYSYFLYLYNWVDGVISLDKTKFRGWGADV